jgi:predicted Rossmann-fold nucleotide-binding protein
MTARKIKIPALAPIAKRIEREKRIIAEARDRLREVISDAQEIGDTCEEAVHELDRAVDHLSEYL